MRSPTQRDLQVDDIAAIVRDGLGAALTGAAELSGGGFATVWRASLTDGRDVVVKVGPPPRARLLGYERGLVAAEAAYFRLVGERAPVPAVLAERDDWLITTFLPGRTLTEVTDPAEADPVRSQLGAAVARIHEITGPRFGYTGDRPSGADWPTAFAAMIDDLRADAAAWDVPLPRLGALDTAALAEVRRPALLHFDLWDGNVLASGDRLTGLVDGERHLYGDPLLDLVSPALFRRIEDEPDHPFLRGYPVDLNDAARHRLTLYRIHLYLLMVAEGPSRGLPVGSDRHAHLTRLLTEEIDRL
ncbi:phosphotransferase family protein [Jidongwangia harbinensis]|uniref:phosphotransferase family protein n=1 Tax=Jidongwangia harbinensis TaxID=2878561 RepID=UPI001CDA4DEE|nr:aminoglycoside phosphotransferase family protein [Jidongwangia harbinensis]MCA2216444.1 aminoglycoside phosphotransferase family protein [Jidongwangia harbinensis]